MTTATSLSRAPAPRASGFLLGGDVCDRPARDLPTGYSGNLDFMNRPTNSWLGHEIVPIGQGAEPVSARGGSGLTPTSTTRPPRCDAGGVSRNRKAAQGAR